MFNIFSNIYTYLYTCILEPTCCQNYFYTCMIYLKMSSISKTLYIVFWARPVDCLRCRVVCTTLGRPSGRLIVHEYIRVYVHLDQSIDCSYVSALCLTRRSTVSMSVLFVCGSTERLVDRQVTTSFWTSLLIDLYLLQ